MKVAFVLSVPADGWQPLTSVVAMSGKPTVTQLLPRRPGRRGAFIANHTNAMTGTTGVVFVFADQQSARAFSSDPAGAMSGGFKGFGVPDGAAYIIEHEGAVWAVGYGGGDQAVVSVSETTSTELMK